jgi:2'-hydroxyisoflavone reductase
MPDVTTLVVGGTGFLGAQIAETARRAGHKVSILSRQPQKVDGIECLLGDRFGPLDALNGRRFDLILDTCAYIPDAVLHLLDRVASPPKRYVIVSSISVHEDFSLPGISEETPVRTASAEERAPYAAVPLAERGKVRMAPESYGPLKRACEIAAFDRLGDQVIALRAGLLVGAGDRSDRLTWWVRRIDLGGPIPVPTDRPVQFIDAGDVAEFGILAAMSGQSGIFNVAGDPIPLYSVLDAIRDLSGSDARFIPCSDQALLDAGIGPWINFPLWLPDTPDTAHFFGIGTGRAKSAGLRTRPLAETLGPLITWDRSRRNQPLTCGLTPEQEQALLG